MVSEHVRLAELAPVLERRWGCPRDVADSVAARARVNAYPARHCIQSSSVSKAMIFVVVTGQARALAVALDGRQVLVEEFGSGDLFGEIAAFAPSHDIDADEVVAHGPVTAGHFATPAFLALMEQHSCIALAVARSLTRRLASANRRVVQIATVSAPGRVHAELLRLGRGGADWRIAPPPVLAELALTIQSTRETVSRAVSALEKRGIVKREEGALLICAPHRLEELVY